MSSSLAAADGVSSIKLAHWVFLNAAEAEVCIGHFADYEIALLFAQFAEPASPIAANAEATEIGARRNWMISNFKCLAAIAAAGTGFDAEAANSWAIERGLPGRASVPLRALCYFTGASFLR